VAINRANAVIDNVPGISMDTSLRSRIVGEAKFLRALNYFNLVRLFGGVPLFTHETVGLDSLQRPRASAAEVYGLIVSDLQDAAKVLPATYAGSSIGRATSGAAKTMLAKVYTQRAATGVGSAADFQSALGLLREVKPSYSLLPEYAHLFDRAHEVNAEVIFDIQASRVPGLGQRLSSQCAPRNSNYGSSQNGSFTAEQPFFDAFTAADKRRAPTFQLSFVNKSNAVVPWTATSTASAAYGADAPYFRKCLDSLSVGYDENNYIVLRHADNLLTEAEVVNELSGPTADAYAAVNAVRQRAGLAALTAGLSKAAFKDSVFAQRRLELSMEGPHGFFDSQRNWEWAKKLVEANMALAAANRFRNSKYPKAQVALTDKFKLMPIPQRAIDLNAALKGQQNPGW
jgi:starch-binding outer membrane protein, SusD/RagB family